MAGQDDEFYIQWREVHAAHPQDALEHSRFP